VAEAALVALLAEVVVVTIMVALLVVALVQIDLPALAQFVLLAPVLHVLSLLPV